MSLSEVQTIFYKLSRIPHQESSHFHWLLYFVFVFAVHQPQLWRWQTSGRMWITVTMSWVPTSSLWVGIKHLIENKSPMIICSCLREGLKTGAALPHFGRDGKGGDTCFFCPFDKFLGHFFLFFAPMSPDFAHCVTCFWNIQNPRYGNCHTGVPPLVFKRIIG